MTYGTISTGFNRKRLPEILADIEAAHVATFGPGVIQTAASPLGQLNGLISDFVATVWELAEDTYQSYDPDQAEGVRLEQLARIRLLERTPGELDPDFRLAITNTGRARIDLADIERAVRNVTGVSWVKVWENNSATVDVNGIPATSIAVAVLGGLDADIAAVVRSYLAPGGGIYGNVQASAVIDGYCRSIALTRPAEVPISLSLTVSTSPGVGGCPPPTVVAMAQAIVEQLSGDARPVNGADIDLHMLQMALSCRFPNVRIASALASISPAAVGALPVAIGFFQIPAFAVERIAITVV